MQEHMNMKTLNNKAGQNLYQVTIVAGIDNYQRVWIGS